MSNPRGAQLQPKSTPLDRLVDGTAQRAIVYDNNGEAVETPHLRIDSVTGDAHVTGVLYASEKFFRIPHPTRDGHILQHCSLEGPEKGVYFRGTVSVQGVAEIRLPDYWSALVEHGSESVQLSKRVSGFAYDVYYDIVDGHLIIEVVSDVKQAVVVSYLVFGERRDVPKLLLEMPFVV